MRSAKTKTPTSTPVNMGRLHDCSPRGVLRASLGLLGWALALIPLPLFSSDPPPPPKLEIAFSVVPLPSGVKLAGVQSPKWVDNAWLLGAFVVGDAAPTVGVLNIDTGEFRDLLATTPVRPWARPSKFQVFPDGRRFTVLEIDGNDATGKRTTTIAECFPDIINSQRIEVLPVEGIDDSGIQNREPRPGYDNETLFWTRVRFSDVVMLAARLTKRADGKAWVAGDPRVLNALPKKWKQSIAGILQRGAVYEFKTTFPDGYAAFSATIAYPNFDNYELDLTTGATRRLTKYAGWDEGVDVHPSGAYFRFGSSRVNSRAFEAASLVPRPGAGSYRRAIFEFPYYLDNPSKKRGLLETWVLDLFGDRVAGVYDSTDSFYFGQQLTADAGAEFQKSGGTTGWSPDGRRFASQERNQRGELRLELQTVTNLPPVAPEPPPSGVLHDLIKRWAPKLSDYPEPDEQYVVTLPGPAGGSVTISATGTLLPGSPALDFKSVFLNYRDKDGLVLNGWEAVSLLGASHKANIVVSGSRNGFFVCDVVYWTGLDGYIQALGYNHAKLGEDEVVERFNDLMVNFKTIDSVYELPWEAFRRTVED